MIWLAVQWTSLQQKILEMALDTYKNSACISVITNLKCYYINSFYIDTEPVWDYLTVNHW